MDFDLGTELNFLSLHDLRGGDAIHDDPMEIDSMELDDREEVISALKKIDSSSDTLDDEEESHHLLLDVFSPTNLGAQYALKQKLLMPPPSPPPATEETKGHDYEFDTSSVQVSRSPAFASVADRSTFDPAENVSFFQNDLQHDFQNNRIGRLATSASVPSHLNYNNSMNRSYQYRRQMFPEQYQQFNSLAHEPEVASVQVHHHHYYYNQSPEHGSGNSFSDHGNSSSAAGAISRSSGFGGSRDYSGSRLVSRNHRGVPSKLDSSSLDPSRLEIVPHALQKHHGGILPLPWDANSVPAERVPYVLSSYLQFALNLVLSCYALHIVVGIVQTIRQDVAYRLESQANNLLVEIALCERSYQENHCSPDTIVPALEKMCAYWEKCMHQDPFKGGNMSLVSAQIIGMVVNLLIEPLSLKFFLVSAGAITVVFSCNFAFGYVRAKTYYGWPSAKAVGPTAT